MVGLALYEIVDITRRSVANIIEYGIPFHSGAGLMLVLAAGIVAGLASFGLRKRKAASVTPRPAPDSPSDWVQASPTRGRSPAVILAGFLLLGLSLGFVFIGRGGSGGDRPGVLPPTPTPVAAVGQYDQTWTKTYATTTCADWNSRMTDHEQYVMAADFLTVFHQSDGIDGVPSDTDIGYWVAGLTAACEADGSDNLKMAEIASLMYVMLQDE